MQWKGQAGPTARARARLRRRARQAVRLQQLLWRDAQQVLRAAVARRVRVELALRRRRRRRRAAAAAAAAAGRVLGVWQLQALRRAHRTQVAPQARVRRAAAAQARAAQRGLRPGRVGRVLAAAAAARRCRPIAAAAAAAAGAAVAVAAVGQPQARQQHLGLVGDALHRVEHRLLLQVPGVATGKGGGGACASTCCFGDRGASWRERPLRRPRPRPPRARVRTACALPRAPPLTPQPRRRPRATRLRGGRGARAKRRVSSCRVRRAPQAPLLPGFPVPAHPLRWPARPSAPGARPGTPFGGPSPAGCSVASALWRVPSVRPGLSS